MRLVALKIEQLHEWGGSKDRWDAPGAQGTRPGTQHKRVTPRHMTMRAFSLPFSSGIKVTTLGVPRTLIPLTPVVA